MIVFKKQSLDENTVNQLVRLSERWVEEDCCWGMVANLKEDLSTPLYVALEGDLIVGYAFGHFEITEKKTSDIEIGEKCFYLDELYVLPNYRNQGIGKELFRLLEEEVKNDCQYLTLSTSTKDYKKVLHFYVEELDMTFHSAFLIKALSRYPTDF